MARLRPGRFTIIAGRLYVYRIWDNDLGVPVPDTEDNDYEYLLNQVNDWNRLDADTQDDITENGPPSITYVKAASDDSSTLTLEEVKVELKAPYILSSRKIQIQQLERLYSLK